MCGSNSAKRQIRSAASDRTGRANRPLRGRAAAAHRPDARRGRRRSCRSRPARRSAAPSPRAGAWRSSLIIAARTAQSRPAFRRSVVRRAMRLRALGRHAELGRVADHVGHGPVGDPDQRVLDRVAVGGLDHQAGGQLIALRHLGDRPFGLRSSARRPGSRPRAPPDRCSTGCRCGEAHPRPVPIRPGRPRTARRAGSACVSSRLRLVLR